MEKDEPRSKVTDARAPLTRLIRALVSFTWRQIIFIISLPLFYLFKFFLPPRAMPPTAAEDANKEERPAAPLRTDTFRVRRPEIVGPDTPVPPFPIALAGQVQRGFGRGGKDLGCPTGGFLLAAAIAPILKGRDHLANLPDESITPISSVAKTGVYYGYAQVLPLKHDATTLRSEDAHVLPMVMSLGWNPFYKNERLTAVNYVFAFFLVLTN